MDYKKIISRFISINVFRIISILLVYLNIEYPIKYKYQMIYKNIDITYLYLLYCNVILKDIEDIDTILYIREFLIFIRIKECELKHNNDTKLLNQDISSIFLN